jgi:hypothetical protein
MNQLIFAFAAQRAINNTEGNSRRCRGQGFRGEVRKLWMAGLPTETYESENSLFEDGTPVLRRDTN